MKYPEIKISLVSNVWTKMMRFHEKDDFMDGHIHTFDHTTLLAKGGVKVTVNGQESYYSAPAIIFIAADNQHDLVATEDDTLCFCIHAMRSGERIEDIVDPKDIPKGSRFYGTSLTK